MNRSDVATPAETVAASCCWLARFKMAPTIGADEGGRRIVTKVESYWHNKACRYCRTPLEELMAKIEAANREFATTEEGKRALSSFRHLPEKARTAKVREAQEAPWYDDLSAVG